MPSNLTGPICITSMRLFKSSSDAAETIKNGYPSANANSPFPFLFFAPHHQAYEQVDPEKDIR